MDKKKWIRKNGGTLKVNTNKLKKTSPYSLRLSKKDKEKIKELSNVLAMTIGEVIILGIKGINNGTIIKKKGKNVVYGKMLTKLRPSSIRLTEDDIRIIRNKRNEMRKSLKQFLTTRELIIMGLNSINIKREIDNKRNQMIKEFLKSKGLE